MSIDRLYVTYQILTLSKVWGVVVARLSAGLSIEGDGGSIPPAAISKLRQFRSPHICLYLSEETLKAGGPFYLLSMPGEVKDPTHVNV